MKPLPLLGLFWLGTPGISEYPKPTSPFTVASPLLLSYFFLVQSPIITLVFSSAEYFVVLHLFSPSLLYPAEMILKK